MSALTARKALDRGLKRAGPWYGEHPKTLKLSEIGRLEELFQHRRPAEHKSRQHVRNMARTPGQFRRDLTPVKVWWAGDDRGWLCVDGHHRLDAYREAEWSEPVPVEVFEGSLDEALLEALRSNTRDHLTMDEREKLDAAWRIVVLIGDAQSKKRIAEDACVSERTIANMRHMAGLFRERWPMHDPSEFSWKHAQLIVRSGEPLPMDDADAAREARIKKLVDALVSKFGPVLSRDPELFAEAIRRVDSALPEALRDAFEQMAGDEEGRSPEDGSPGDCLPFPLPTAEEEIF